MRFAVLGNLALLFGRIAFARSSWNAKIQADKLKKRNEGHNEMSPVSEVSSYIADIEIVREMWRKGSFESFGLSRRSSLPICEGEDLHEMET